MSFLTPWVAAGAAAVTVPALLLLYFLKLRRAPQRVPSTLLWQKSFEDLEVNAPFQRIRFSLLLLLQLLILALLLLALAQPRVEAAGIAVDQLIVLIDRSASMRATDGDGGGTRLDEAKVRALDLVDEMARSPGTQMMVIEVGASSRVVAPFTADRRALRRAIESIEPSDEEADLQGALDLASAFSYSEEEVEVILPDVLLISDGALARIETMEPLAVRAQNFRFTRVGPPAPADGDDDGGGFDPNGDGALDENGATNDDTNTNTANDGTASGDAAAPARFDNIGIVAFNARRDRDNAEEVRFFTRVINTRPEAVRTTLTLRAGGETLATRRVTIPAADADGPGEYGTRFRVDLPGGALVTIRHNESDVLGSDNTAALVIPPPAPPDVLVVHDGGGADPFLLSAVEVFDPDPLRTMTLDEYTDYLDATDREPDLIVFDRVSAALPSVPSLTVGAAPQAIDTVASDETGGQPIISWDRQHPLLQHVNLDSIVFAGFAGYDLPTHADAVAHGPAGPVIATVRLRGATHALVGFELMNSNWPRHPSILVFLQNVLDHIRQDGGGDVSMTWRPGETIRVPVHRDAGTVEVSGPMSASVDVTGSERVTLPMLREVGVYSAAGARPPHDVLAVSLLSDAESDIRTSDSVTVNAERATAGAVTEQAWRDIWPWLIAAGLVLLAAEWLIYVRRASI